MKPPYAIGSVPSLSGNAVAYQWRSLPRVRRHRASKPQGSSERVLPWQITMDQLIFASLSHTHYWYDVGMLKVPAVSKFNMGKLKFIRLVLRWVYTFCKLTYVIYIYALSSSLYRIYIILQRHTNTHILYMCVLCCKSSAPATYVVSYTICGVRQDVDACMRTYTHNKTRLIRGFGNKYH